jgi:hypothetical protein
MTRSRDVADTQDNSGGAVAPFVAGKNAVINGGFDIWQRGTSFAMSSAGYSADRWYQSARSGETISRQATSDSTNLPFIQYCTRVARDSGNTSTDAIRIATLFESVNSIPFAGKTVTLSFYARRGANFSSASNGLTAQLATGTGTDQNLFAGGYTGLAYPVASEVTLTTTWQRFTLTGTIASTATELTLLFYFVPVGTAGAADYFEITGVQLEVGSVATPFSRNGGTIQGELAACQRYYFRQTATAAYSNLTGFGYQQGATSAQYSFFPTVTMRTKPSSVDFSAIKVSDYNSSFAITAFTLNGNNADGSYFLVDATIASGGTAGRPSVIQANNNSAAYIGFSAEL